MFCPIILYIEFLLEGIKSTVFALDILKSCDFFNTQAGLYPVSHVVSFDIFPFNKVPPRFKFVAETSPTLMFPPAPILTREEGSSILASVRIPSPIILPPEPVIVPVPDITTSLSTKDFNFKSPVTVAPVPLAVNVEPCNSCCSVENVAPAPSAFAFVPERGSSSSLEFGIDASLVATIPALELTSVFPTAPAPIFA